MSRPHANQVPAVKPGLRAYTVHLRRRGGETQGRIEVQAASVPHAERVAVRQNIEVSFPKSKPANWIVTSVEGPHP